MDGTYSRRGISLVALGLLVLIMIGCGVGGGFTAETTKGEAGLYRAEGETRDGGEYVGGWIVLAEGEQQRGALGIRDGTSNTISGSTLNAESLRAADSGVSPIDFPTSR